jgi:rare lipoprotein A
VYLGEGLASYYGPGLHGRKTASGERFDQNALTAAHRTARFGTCLRVVNMENGKAVEVRVNDRGPFKDERLIDVSLGAARKLDMVAKGLARVRLYRCKDEDPVSAFSIPLRALPG